ncbi:MAG: extracellular solute-binding protein [Lachnospiraceae bacterium]|nr:extracellular solute-binding protein [Lachnospiraceae bacterium]
MKKVRHILNILLSSLLAVSVLSGCGAGKDGASGSGTAGTAETTAAKEDSSLSEYTYMASFTTSPENGDFYSCEIADGLLWSQVYEEDGNGGSVSILKGMDPETLETKSQLTVGDLVEAPAADEAAGEFVNTYLTDYGFADDGTMYAVICVYQYKEGSEDYKNTYYLVHLTKEGEVLSSSDISEALGEDGYVNYLEIDEAGNLYMAGDGKVVLVDSEGNPSGTCELSDWPNGMFCYQGKVYVMLYGESGPEAYPIDFAGAKLGNKLEGFPFNRGSYRTSETTDGKLLEYSSSEAYINDPASGKGEMLFKWTDLNIAGDQVQALTQTGEDAYMAVIYDWNSGEASIANIKKVLRSEVPDTKTLTLGMLYEDQNVTSSVIKFNKSQSDYRIEIKTYYDWNNDMAYEEAITNFQNDLTGGNPPDMIYFGNYGMEGLDFSTLQSKGIIVDLNGFIENSSEVNLQDYAPEALDAFSADGKIYGIPTTVIARVPTGKASILGSEPGWTVDECMDLIEAHPEADILDYTDRSYSARILMGYSMERFANFETGEVNLNTPEFKKVLEFLKKQKSEIDYAEYESMESSPKRMEAGKILMMENSFSGPEDIQMYEAMTGGACFIGYPTMDGKPCYGLDFDGACMITNNCSDPEAAFSLISFLLNQEPDRFMYGIPSNLTAREQYFEKYFTPEGSIEGNGIGWDDWEYTYHDVTREDVAKLNEILANAKVMDPHFNEIYAIIDEEAQAFYNNQKSAEDVMEIIQSRVSLYINENR